MSTQPEIYTIKPALLVGVRDYHIYDDRLEVWRDGDIKDQIALSDIQSARYAETTAREYKFWRLDLFTNAEKPLRIHVTSSVAANRQNDSDVETFYSLVSVLSSKLSTLHPEMTVPIGETQKATWIMFSIGIAGVLVALGMFVLAIVTNVPDHKLKNAMTPFGVLFFFGLYVCFTSNPWKRKPRLTWDAVQDMIAII